MYEASDVPGVEVSIISDPDRRRMEGTAVELEKKTGKRPRTEVDLRRILDDPEIDAVVIASCDHWHALATIWACQAGKHVYVEKPVCHNLFEGRKMLEAARKYGRIVQTGTQRRSNGSFRKAAQLIREGAIGEVYWASFDLPNPRDPIGFKKPEPVPSWLEWDLWLGPAEMQPYHANLVHYNWQWFWDFGNGELATNGVHLLDIARWCLGKNLPARIHSVGGRYGPPDQGETPNAQKATFRYEDGTLLTGEVRNLYSAQGRVRPRRPGGPDPRHRWLDELSWSFYGSQGYLHLKPRQGGGREEAPRQLAKRYGCEYQVFLGRNPDPEPDQGILEHQDHFGNFVEAIRSGRPEILTAGLEDGVLSASHCIMANFSLRLGRELRYDVATHRFLGDDEANRLLTRTYREPFVVPDKV